MKSSNPHSGCRAVEVAKTLDTTDPNPSKNQGGIAVVQPIPYTLKIRSGCEGGGKGALIQEDKSATLATNNDQYLFQPVRPVAQAAGFCTEHSAKARGVGYQEECAPTLRAGVTPAVLCKSWDARGNGDGATANTITGDHENRVTDYTSVVVEPIPIHDQATRFSGKRGDKADGKGNGLGVGQEGDPMNTLTSGDRHAVAYREEPRTLHNNTYASTLMARDYKGVGRWDTLGAVVSVPTGSKYIVRRLTPTECARLQGFADWWGWIEEKKDFTGEEYCFWLEVRNTHARINGKKEQEYTGRQMLTWYNKLWTDSSEYKMWGNGIALPTALYCLQGITDALKIEEESATHD